VTVGEADEFDRQFRRMLDDAQMGYLVAKIEPWAKHQWEWKDRKATDGVEDKYRFLRYVEKLEGSSSILARCRTDRRSPG